MNRAAEQTEQQRKNTLKRLHDRLSRAMSKKPSAETSVIEDPQEVVKLIKKAEAENKEAATVSKVEVFNRQEAAKREKLKRVLSLSLPDEDITNEDGTIHAVKIRKFPELEKLRADFGRLSLGWDYNAKRYTTATVGGFKVDLCKTNYHNGSPNTYEDFTDFNGACSVNQIEPKPLSVKKVLRDIIKIKTEDERMRKELKKHSDKLSALNVRTLAKFGAINEQRETRYTYYY